MKWLDLIFGTKDDVEETPKKTKRHNVYSKHAKKLMDYARDNHGLITHADAENVLSYLSDGGRYLTRLREVGYLRVYSEYTHPLTNKPRKIYAITSYQKYSCDREVRLMQEQSKEKTCQ